MATQNRSKQTPIKNRCQCRLWYPFAVPIRIRCRCGRYNGKVSPWFPLTILRRQSDWLVHWLVHWSVHWWCDGLRLVTAPTHPQKIHAKKKLTFAPCRQDKADGSKEHRWEGSEEATGHKGSSEGCTIKRRYKKTPQVPPRDRRPQRDP